MINKEILNKHMADLKALPKLSPGLEAEKPKLTVLLDTLESSVVLLGDAIDLGGIYTYLRASMVVTKTCYMLFGYLYESTAENRDEVAVVVDTIRKIDDLIVLK